MIQVIMYIFSIITGISILKELVSNKEIYWCDILDASDTWFGITGFIICLCIFIITEIDRIYDSFPYWFPLDNRIFMEIKDRFANNRLFCFLLIYYLIERGIIELFSSSVYAYRSISINNVNIFNRILIQSIILHIIFIL